MARARRTNVPYLPGAAESGARPPGSLARFAAGHGASLIRSGVNQAALLWTRAGRGGGRVTMNSQPFSARRGRRR